jgi:hypothetical protein
LRIGGPVARFDVRLAGAQRGLLETFAGTERVIERKESVRTIIRRTSFLVNGKFPGSSSAPPTAIP